MNRLASFRRVCFSAAPRSVVRASSLISFTGLTLTLVGASSCGEDASSSGDPVTSSTTPPAGSPSAVDPGVPGAVPPIPGPGDPNPVAVVPENPPVDVPLTPTPDPGAPAGPPASPGAGAAPAVSPLPIEPGAGATPAVIPGAGAAPAVSPGAGAAPAIEPGAGAAPAVLPDDMSGMGGMGGAEGAPPVGGDVVLTASGNSYTLQVGDLEFAADGPSGRVTALNFGGGNLLTTSAVNDTNYGSSFWTAPQDWEWPPAIDAAAYSHEIADSSIVFLSADVALNDNTVTVTKRFWGEAARQAIGLEYTVQNVGSAAMSLAPWEITRVRASGVTFYPAGDNAPVAQTGEFSPPAIGTLSTADGVVWIDLSGAEVEGKSVSDGSEGWLAHVDGGVLFLKTFPDIPATAQAPGEAEIEIYTAPDDTYVELEQQGTYGSVAAGAASTPWTVYWRVRPVPAELDVSVGSTALVDWVRSVVAE